MRTLLRSLIFLALPLTAAAQGYDLTLHHTDPEALPAEARAHHQRAVEALDHIDTTTAIREMKAAAEAAPDSMEMQMHFITLALRDVGPDTHTLSERIALADAMLDAYDRLLAQEEIPEPLIEFFEREKTNFQAYMLAIDERMAQSREASEQFAEAYASHMQQVREAQERWEQSQERMETFTPAPAPAPAARARVQEADDVPSDGTGSAAIQPDPRLPLREDERTGAEVDH